MINFEEELKKYQPSLEVGDVQDAIYNQDLTDVSDIVVRMVKDSLEGERGGKPGMTIPKL